MADNGFQKLGFLLGGGAGQVREEAYQEGRYRTAQTENALASARENQLQAEAEARKLKARAQIEDNIIATGGDPNEARLLGSLAVGEAGSDFKAGMEGLQVGQETDFRETLGNPDADPLAQFAAGQGVQGKVLSPYAMTGSGDAVDLRAPAAPGAEPDFLTTPLGETMAAENVASAAASNELAALRGRTPRLGGASGLDADGNPLPFKVPSNFKVNPNFDPEKPPGPGNEEIVPISGGPKDPNTPGTLGSRERQIIIRVIGAARNTVSDLQNIMSLPSGASRGVLGTGIGGAPGASVLEATVDTLKNRVAEEEVRDYNAMLGGFTNALATIERQGLVGSDGLSAQYESLILRPEDTTLNKMRKIALVRQAVENGLEPHLYSNVLPPELEAYVGNLITSVKQAVPFSPRDVALLGVEPEGSRVTIADIINEAGADIPIGPDGLPVQVEVAAPGEGVPDAQAGAAASGEIPENPEPGFRYTDPEDSTEWEFGGGDVKDPANWYQVAQ